MKFSGGLRNIPGGWELFSGFDKFSGWLHGKFSGGVKTFSRRVEYFLGGRGFRFFQERLRIFHKGLGFFGKGLRFSSSVWYCFSYGYVILGEGEFFNEVEIFPGGVLIFLEGWRCFRKCLGFFREGLVLFPWCWVCSGDLKYFFWGGGDIFRVTNFYFHEHSKIEAF